MPRTRPASGRYATLLVLGALAGAAGTGCGSSTYPVEGKVLSKDGSAIPELEGCTVVFETEDGKVSAQGSVAADGSFRLSTYKPNDGALPGKHRVLISPPPIYDNPPAPVIIDPRYHDFKSSGLAVTVGPKKNEVLLKVDRARVRR
jgi:hypothetical protein